MEVRSSCLLKGLPSWVSPGVRGPISFELSRKNLKDMGELTFDDREMLEQVSAYYFQINSVWKQGLTLLFTWRIPLLKWDAGTRMAYWVSSLWNMADYNSWLVGLRRGVDVKTSASTTSHHSPLHRGPSRSGRDERPAPPPQPSELQPRSAIFVQCAASTNDRDLAVTLLKARRDGALNALDAETNLSLSKLRNRLLLTGGVAFLLAVVGFALCSGKVGLRRCLDPTRYWRSERISRLRVDQRLMPGELLDHRPAGDDVRNAKKSVCPRKTGDGRHLP